MSCAPCDGGIISIAAARHAVAMRADGAILLHVGIDGVGSGRGFDLKVRKGSCARRRFAVDVRPRPAGAGGHQPR
jgi:phosphotransferase system IIA component